MNTNLNTDELNIWHAWKSMHTAAMNAIAQEIAEQTGLSEGDFGVLSRLSELGEGQLRQQDLADSMKWSKSRLSHHLTRMQKRGLIERRPLASEPGVLVVITAVGQSAIDSARPIHAAAVRKHLLDQLTVDDREMILALATRLATSPEVKE
ncbi:MarR family winged helix-turn-helix transcriptional regulator [Paenibacillus sp. NPDC057934]|uniref:MarR family winged helix-turn-helix transcriptional regulator n=1 Tax=Paenibacillus sp. NPDC057934 TaxID=3346282 RepID=UPI0036D819A7